MAGQHIFCMKATPVERIGLCTCHAQQIIHEGCIGSLPKTNKHCLVRWPNYKSNHICFLSFGSYKRRSPSVSVVECCIAACNDLGAIAKLIESYIREAIIRALRKICSVVEHDETYERCLGRVLRCIETAVYGKQQNKCIGRVGSCCEMLSIKANT